MIPKPCISYGPHLLPRVTTIVCRHVAVLCNCFLSSNSLESQETANKLYKIFLKNILKQLFAALCKGNREFEDILEHSEAVK